jgi:hypothetical protein
MPTSKRARSCVHALRAPVPIEFPAKDDWQPLTATEVNAGYCQKAVYEAVSFTFTMRTMENVEVKTYSQHVFTPTITPLLRVSK